MGELTARNFGLLIAYLIPGFICLWGLSPHVPQLHAWLAGAATPGPTLGGFLFVTIASVAAGLTASAVRWAVLDSIHAATGIQRPAWNDRSLSDKLTAFDYLVEQHYRYYQFYGNTLVATAFAYVAWRLSLASRPSLWLDFGVALLELVFLAGSRDALRKYYGRASLLLGTSHKEISNDERERPRPTGRSSGSETTEDGLASQARPAARASDADDKDDAEAA